MEKLAIFLIKAMLAPFAALPLRVHYFNARWIAALLGSVLGYRRDDVMVNLSRCFPEKSYDELRKIKKDFYRHFADLAVEAIWFGGCHNAKRLRKAGLVRLVNPEILDSVGATPPGVMVLCSHCGNWEILGGLCNANYCTAAAQAGFPVTEESLCVSYLAQSPVWDRIIRDNRFAPLDASRIEGYMETRSSVRFIMSHREQRLFYHMITDQHPYLKGSGKMTVKFFGRECTTMSAGAALACKVGIPVLYLRMSIESRGHYTMEYVPVCTDPAEATPQQIMDRYYSLLEEDIRTQPHNYLWTHRRWKMIY